MRGPCSTAPSWRSRIPSASAIKLLAALVRAGIGCRLRQRRGANGEAEFTLYVDRADLDAARAAVADLSALSAKYL